MRHRLFQKFEDCVEVIPFHQCWEWTGLIDKKGYGRFHIGKNKYAKAHRHSLGKSQELVPGLMVDHICRNRSCVNPRHLRQVTATINATENSISIAAVNKMKSGCINGHPYNEENTIIKKNGNRWCKQCKRIKNREYKARIRNGRTKNSAAAKAEDSL